MVLSMAAMVFACAVFCLFCAVFVSVSTTSYRKEVLLHIRGSMPAGIVPTVLYQYSGYPGEGGDVFCRCCEVHQAAIWQERMLPGSP